MRLLLINSIITQIFQHYRYCERCINYRVLLRIQQNPRNFCDKTFRNHKMASTTFEGLPDRFNGITVYSTEENCEIDEFSNKLNRSLELWQEQHKRCIWFKVFIAQTRWVPILIEKGFKYHHAKNDFVMLYLWLPKDEISNIPPYAHTMLGVGAVVVNSDQQLLVVNEKYYKIPHWKLPGGYVEPNENLVDAAIREVYEETNIRTKFSSVLCLRHTHHGMFECSDIYAVIHLVPIDFDIKSDNREIQLCKWMDINEFLVHPHVHELNRFFVQKYLEYQKKNLKINWEHGIHQILKKPYTVYFTQIIENDNDNDDEKDATKSTN